MEPPIGHSEILLRLIPQRNAGRWPHQSIGLAFSVGFYRDDGAFQKKVGGQQQDVTHGLTYREKLGEFFETLLEASKFIVFDTEH